VELGGYLMMCVMLLRLCRLFGNVLMGCLCYSMVVLCSWEVSC